MAKFPKTVFIVPDSDDDYSLAEGVDANDPDTALSAEVYLGGENFSEGTLVAEYKLVNVKKVETILVPAGTYEL